MKYLWHGLVDYEASYQQQLKFLKTQNNEIWGVEHSKVITLGLRAESQGEVSESQLSGEVKIIRVDRGGQATLHNQGQLVIYPQFNLSKYGFGVRTYVEALVNVTHQLLHELNVPYLKDSAEVGLFTPKGKIGSVGIRVQKGRCYHGLALNVCNNLEDFVAVRSCGIWNRTQDRLQNWNLKLSVEEVYWLWIKHWEKYLSEI